MAKIHVFFNIKRRYYLIIDNAFLINKLSIFGVNSLEKIVLFFDYWSKVK